MDARECVDGQAMVLCLLIRFYLQSECADEEVRSTEYTITCKSRMELVRFLSRVIQSTAKSRSEYAQIKSQLGMAISMEEDRNTITRWLNSTILQAMDSIHSLHELVDGLSDLILSDTVPALIETNNGMHGSRVSPSSLFGTFLRAFIVEINRELFDGLIRLHDVIAAFITSEESNTAQKPTETHDRTEHCRAVEVNTQTSMRVILHHTELQVSEKQHVEDVYKAYSRYVESGDYPNALDALHRYHDLALRDRAMRTSNNLACSKLLPKPVGMQYAALNVAALQLTMHCYENAYESLQESIKISEHHGDHLCVALALLWLFKVQQNLGKSFGSTMSTLQSWSTNADSTQPRAVQIMINLAQLESLLCGSGKLKPEANVLQECIVLLPSITKPTAHPLEVWLSFNGALQPLMEMSDTSCALRDVGLRNTGQLHRIRNGTFERNIRRNASSGIQCGSGLAWLTSSKATLQLLWQLTGRAYVDTSVLLRVFGDQHLARIFDQIYSECYSETASIAELANIVAELALHRTLDEPLTRGSCVYVRSIRFLVEKAHAYPGLVNQRAFQCSVHRMLCNWALNRHEYVRARVHSEALLSLCPIRNDLSAHIAARMTMVRLQQSQRHFEAALRSLALMEKICQRRNWTFLVCDIMVHKLQVEFEADPPKSLAMIEDVIACVSKCEDHGFSLLAAKSKLTLAKIYASVGNWNCTDTILKEKMAIVLENGDLQLQGHYLMMLCKSKFAKLNSKEYGLIGEKRSENWMELLKALDHASARFELVEDVHALKETYYIRAFVHHRMERCEQNTACSFWKNSARLKEEAAAKFLELQDQESIGRTRSINADYNMEAPSAILQLAEKRANESA
uniref:Anaphase-promoting complex subunit 5 n=1 Tax=Albugo laibachii Nc14 TaxID=890382 RepID=F0WSW5_9STRA|nr:anaphasepromoting complex subunit 5 putative [Albugo laibachii Nc14]CCA25116.1 anaphasepromoting complex subunit 5 putative [Albugo laibachii Nc14]|eukprot:CCA25116.1 anaphasepromoting complex subunit 5 putative [Albugo laibachii Nc14]